MYRLSHTRARVVMVIILQFEERSIYRYILLMIANILGDYSLY